MSIGKFEASSMMLRLEMGLHIEVTRWGPMPPQPQIVLLHEGLGSVSTWRRFPEQLALETGLGVVAYSREGYGRSSPLQGPNNVDYLAVEARRLPGVLDAIGIRQAYLLGHSDGATIALLAAALHGDRIRAVLAEAPHLYVEPETQKAVRGVGLAWEEGALKRALSCHHHRPEPIFRRWHDLWTSEGFAQRFDIRWCLSKIRCPVLAVQGTEDAFASPRQLADIQRIVASGGTFWFEGCGHEPHRSFPDAIIRMATDMQRI
ncbi:pimeloyl-ACP methyl ester carboxylesterase [Rhizobium sp. BK181]|uniref:alpha/beta fold hydrolase n=1 Tax=Rhizobium sp. BK181 TaxID=2587072 RepID=UPI001613CE31|nr:alpha/beta hydrolase [Rhizobium sp. BK181]MBB3319861.1 pimeloyl-ACP methyl ester carboxylesterase [Rhizobium sp. BK181]